MFDFLTKIYYNIYRWWNKIITYRLNKQIIGRTAANLVFELSKTKGVRIIKGDRCFNGKSLIGILANNLKEDDVIKISLDSSVDIPIVKEAFNFLGKEVA